MTTRRLAARGVGQGWQCLEAGAGVGSIARWLSGQVGRDGTVVAADIDISMLAEMPGNVQVRQLDVATEPLPEAAFDLIHTRLVLNHVAEREMVLDKFAAALRPGGWLLAEEGDTFSVGRSMRKKTTRAMRAWCDDLAEVADVDLGRRLLGMLSARGLADIGVECEVPFAEGGLIGVEWLQLTFDQLNDRAGGHALDADTILRWKRMLRDPGRWFASLGLVAAWGRRVR